MNRPPGVIISAVIAILGSLGVGAMAVLMIFGGLMLAYGPGMPANAMPPTPIPLFAIIAIESFFFAAFAVFGIVSAVGLLRLRNWARICFVIFGVILAVFAGSSIFGGFFMLFAMPQMMPPNPNVPPGLMTGVAVVMTLTSLLLEGLAIWWLIYFNRRPIKAEFMGEAAAAIPRRGPLSVTVIGWILVIGAVLNAITAMLTNYPLIFLGILIQGWVGKVVYLSLAAVSFVAGMGLLKWRRWAFSAALGVYAFWALNTILGLVTGAMSRMQEIMMERMGPTPYPVPAGPFVAFTMILVVAMFAIVFSILISRRRAFIAACETPVSTLS